MPSCWQRLSGRSALSAQWPWLLLEQAPFYLVVETSGSNAEHDCAKLEAFLEDIQQSGVSDGTLAQDSSQAAAIWGLRENISEGLRHAGARSYLAAPWQLRTRAPCSGWS